MGKNLDIATGLETDVPDVPPTPEEIAEMAVRARIRARWEYASSEAALASVLKNVTPQEAVDWINTSVTDLASAKVALKYMARMLIALRDAVMPELPEQ
jgi:hypothetical protein